LRVIQSTLLVAGLLLVSTAPAGAGNNAGASAYLSWDPANVVDDLLAVPSEPFPLYLHLRGTSDISKLAVTLRWAQYDSTAAHYTVLSDSNSTDSCGWNAAQLPGESFAGDSTYTWTLSFPPGASRTCIVYRLVCGGCYTCPADFLLAAVFALDSNGDVDTLAVTGNTTILGGIGFGGVTALQSVTPTGVVPGEMVSLRLRGLGFRQGMKVRMAGHAGTFSASVVDVVSPSQATAVIEVPPSASGSLAMRIEDVASDLLTAQDSVIRVFAAADTDTVLVTLTTDDAQTACSEAYGTFDDISSCQNTHLFCQVTRCPSHLFHGPDCELDTPLSPREFLFELAFRNWRGDPLVGYTVHSAYESHAGSASHCHDVGRPAFFTDSGGTFARLDAEDKVTDTTGTCYYRVILPEQAGLIHVSAEVVGYQHGNDLPPRAGFSTFVRVPGLVDLHEQGIARCITADIYHPKNSYVDPSVIEPLKNLFLRAFGMDVPEDGLLGSLPEPSEPGSEWVDLVDFAWHMFNYYGVEIDDASLPFGGVFDVAHTWRAPYCLHRDGYSVDLRPKDRMRALTFRLWLATACAASASTPVLLEHYTIKDDLPRFHLEWGLSE